MNYDEAMIFFKKLTKFGWNPGLQRIQKLMSLLDNPEKKLKVIHIGGTNGKGSTSAMVASILQEAGYRVGLFTSPHLHSYTERIQINRVQIEKERLAQLLNTIKPYMEQMVADGYEHPTEFEVYTAMALLYFAQEKVDFAVIEVGLGGLIDSTNVVDPLVAVITNVGMDHMDYLGSTIQEITRVKAGIIKPGCKVVTAVDNREALEIIKEVCQKNKVELIQVGKDIKYDVKSMTPEGTVFDFCGLNQTLTDLKTSLLGYHQAVNGATAVTAILALAYFGLKIPLEAVRRGLTKTVWAARLEVISQNPMILLDAAHNVDGAVSLKHALKHIFKYKKLILVIGMLADKERHKVMEALGPLAHTVIVTKPNNPRATNWQSMAEVASKYTSQVFVEEKIEGAVEKGLTLIEKDDLLCITGSIYMVADARAYLMSKKGINKGK
ncbi:MAG: bifunctional folylpolyglutamate synthase/dihydrofolate synthase [Zhaonellaceae bacterium]|jgi:dihydrofolate synthase/folylpolyglutamate synthase|nr:bifunctional folylpolyglutamate synthase/dihydrofolate synthase [Clostridia bacterium]